MNVSKLRLSVVQQDGKWVIRNDKMPLDRWNYDKHDYETLATVDTVDEANIFMEGFKWRESCKSLAELKASTQIFTPVELAYKYCAESLANVGRHNAYKFANPQIAHWWLATSMARGKYFDFDAYTLDAVTEELCNAVKKIVDMYCA